MTYLTCSIFQWHREAFEIVKEHFGGKDQLCGIIYFNTGCHHEKRGELQEAYENFKQSYPDRKRGILNMPTKLLDIHIFH